MRLSKIDMERRREMRGGEGEGERGEKRGTGGARGGRVRGEEGEVTRDGQGSKGRC